MNNKVFQNGWANRPANPDKLLRVTSLLYLKDALFNQRYEECPELIRAAKGFGARPSEIRRVIAQDLRRFKAGQPNEARPRSQSRPRF